MLDLYIFFLKLHFNATYKIPINSPNSEQMKCIFPIKYAHDFVVHCFVALHIDGLVKDYSNSSNGVTAAGTKPSIYIDELAQDYSNSSVLAVELLQSCTKLSMF